MVNGHGKMALKVTECSSAKRRDLKNISDAKQFRISDKVRVSHDLCSEWLGTLD